MYEHDDIVKEIELKLLRLMYNDVAVRSPTEIMSKENFYIFFHINVSPSST
jgi:hypothetical protein